MEYYLIIFEAILFVYMWFDFALGGPVISFFTRILSALGYADDRYGNCNPPPALWIDKKTNTWCTREYTDFEKWCICFKARMRRR